MKRHILLIFLVMVMFMFAGVGECAVEDDQDSVIKQEGIFGFKWGDSFATIHRNVIYKHWELIEYTPIYEYLQAEDFKPVALAEYEAILFNERANIDLWFSDEKVFCVNIVFNRVSPSHSLRPLQGAFYTVLHEKYGYAQSGEDFFETDTLYSGLGGDDLSVISTLAMTVWDVGDVTIILQDDGDYEMDITKLTLTYFYKPLHDEEVTDLVNMLGIEKDYEKDGTKYAVYMRNAQKSMNEEL